MESDPGARSFQPPADARPPSDPEELRVLYAALDSFRQYRRAAHYNITHLRRQSFYSLPSAHMDLLSEPPFSLPETFDAVDDAIDCNADIAEAILTAGLSFFGVSLNDEFWKGQATPSDMDKARSTLRQLYRDWSYEGREERLASYFTMISALDLYLPSHSREESPQRHQQRILVPGAGLGRLAFDLCTEGYNVEGNEISYHQILAANYILNCASAAGQHQLYPWALNFSNHLTRTAQMGSVSVPDLHPCDMLRGTACGRMSVISGDFCELYRRPKHADAFDGVATCFFIDTAPNLINYIETVTHCLKPGGIWVNEGPLLWHFEAGPTPAEQHKKRQSGGANGHQQSGSHASGGIGEPGSFELSNDEVVALVERLGFDILEQMQAAPRNTGYIQGPASMLQSIYRPSFWVVRKRWNS
ncbi:hypothetical protein LTR85_000293 [Meristemomyces frigidus]|nr:hypothetical protein LTR85_000293 [Meristemomyces frigidus]